LLSSVTDPLVAGLRADLAAGRTVDFVAFTKTFASAMACAMMGIAVDPADERGAYADMFALATEFTALAGLGKRRLSAVETTKAHRITDRLAATFDDASPNQLPKWVLPQIGQTLLLHAFTDS
jgi:hypothetical protein